jgi:hypothetical protein
MAIVARTVPDPAREAVEQSVHTFGALLTLTRSRIRSTNVSHAAATLLRYLVRGSSAAKGWRSGSRRRIAKTGDLTEWQVRAALDHLVTWGWIERREAAARAGAHYRVTAAFLEAVEGAGDEVHGILGPYVALHAFRNEPGASGAAITPKLSGHLRKYTPQDLIQRLVTLNERPKRHGRGYSKTVLRGTANALHCFIQAALRGDEPRFTSLRGLAHETGLTFRSAKHARARLITWGLLTAQDGTYALDHARLAKMLFEDQAALPSTPAVSRRRDTVRAMCSHGANQSGVTQPMQSTVKR